MIGHVLSAVGARARSAARLACSRRRISCLRRLGLGLLPPSAFVLTLGSVLTAGFSAAEGPLRPGISGLPPLIVARLGRKPAGTLGLVSGNHVAASVVLALPLILRGLLALHRAFGEPRYAQAEKMP